MRRGAILAALLIFLAGLALFFAVHGLVTDSPEGKMHGLINQARELRGLDRLQVTDFLRAYAEGQARAMRARGRVFHDPCEGCAEVVGVVGGAPYSIFAAWMRSPAHYAVLMSPRTKLGCGVVEDGRGLKYWACELRY